MARPESRSLSRRVQSAQERRGHPLRTCLGCGAKAKKLELVRLAVVAGMLVVDGKGVLPGRGVYCCRKAGCYQRLAKQRKKLVWALRYQEAEMTGPLVVSQGLDAEFGVIVG